MCLLVCDRHVLASTVETNDKYVVPDDITRADVYVDVQVHLKNPVDKETMQVLQLANKVKETAKKKLKEWYTGEKGKAKFAIKVKVVQARRGSCWNAMTCGMLGRTAVTSVEWFFKTSNGLKTYKSGRVTYSGSHMCDEQHALEYQAPCRLVQDIVDHMGIRNRSASVV